MLTDLHKTQRLGSALTFLERYLNEGEDVLDQIVTGDETWVAYVTPESKQQSMEWRHSSSPKRVKFNQTISARKIMGTVFWDRKGVLLVEFLPRNETINAASVERKEPTEDSNTSVDTATYRGVTKDYHSK
ncbi:HTH_48 domain-containing protein [Trichonephila clavata]|uniref:HTH_48 domain-containing protein n=1 Tax=Trichonephila clavata TaxID=2740835 RepID=A0A8X6KUA3_TRICU|nr:HTH_48 domain-containing protein [Trichonephila clavata]